MVLGPYLQNITLCAITLFMKLIVYFLAIFMLLPSWGFAQNEQHIQAIERYLNSITTLESAFVQTTSEGDVSTGMFYLSRPGNLRWEYDPPTPVSIIAKGSILTYYDKELEEVSHVGLGDTLAGLLTRQNITFDDTITILDYTTLENDDLSLTVAQNNGEEQSTLTMIFSPNPMQLHAMVIHDAVGKIIHIALDGVKQGVELDKELFIVPRVKNRSKRNRR